MSSILAKPFGFRLMVFLTGIILVSGDRACSEPLVVGYERFYSEEASVEGGAILFSELGCASCHGGSDIVVPRRGPTLTNLRSRVDREWVREFLKSPESGRKGTTMPSMLHGLTDSEIDAVVAYLGTLGPGLKLRAERHANAERGSALYHEKGCVACHEPTDDYRGSQARGDQFESALAIAHPDLARKTSLAALHYFLMQPSKIRMDGRMPHIPLEKQEALDLAAHLLDFQSSDPREAVPVKPWPKATKEMVALGEELVRKHNCGACHSLPEIEPASLKPLQLPAKSNGCISGTEEPGLPFYDLDEGQKKSLLLFLASSQENNHEELTLAAMNCLACHERGGVGGATPETDPYFVGVESLGDSGRLPPPLTGTGHKLLPEAMRNVFAGSEGSRVRSYLRTEMPVYGQHADALTAWLQKQDEKPGTKPDPSVENVSSDFVEAGRKLLGIHGGVNCITCHQWNDRASLGIPALDISALDRRVRYDWFHEYLLNPASYRPGTLMPPLWPGGKSTVPDVLDGNAGKQIEAIWTFIAKGEGVPKGFPDRSGEQFELIPEDKPIIQRTFFTKAGTKAILVGFPGGIHLAFDGARGRPAVLWRGPFFDAYDTWFTRAAPFGDPLSEEVFDFPEDRADRRFLGYELDKDGNPTFLLRESDQELREQYRVMNGKMYRLVRWESGKAPTLFHPEGVEKTVQRKEGAIEIHYFWK